MRAKWNWLDTVIVVLIVIVVAGVCIFLFRPTGASEIATPQQSDLYVTFITSKAPRGTYDAIKVGDTLYTVDTGKEFGIIEKVESVASETAVFDESIKEYKVYKNELSPYCRITVKTDGYFNEIGEAYAKGRAVILEAEWSLETASYRFMGAIAGVKGVDEQ